MSNERILVSRNKREGWYMGRTHYDHRTGSIGPQRHARAGIVEPIPMGLRDWQRHPQRVYKMTVTF